MQKTEEEMFRNRQGYKSEPILQKSLLKDFCLYVKCMYFWCFIFYIFFLLIYFYLGNQPLFKENKIICLFDCHSLVRLFILIYSFIPDWFVRMLVHWIDAFKF